MGDWASLSSWKDVWEVYQGDVCVRLKPHFSPERLCQLVLVGCPALCRAAASCSQQSHNLQPQNRGVSTFYCNTCRMGIGLGAYGSEVMAKRYVWGHLHLIYSCLLQMMVLHTLWYVAVSQHQPVVVTWTSKAGGRISCQRLSDSQRPGARKKMQALRE